MQKDAALDGLWVAPVYPYLSYTGGPSAPDAWSNNMHGPNPPRLRLCVCPRCISPVLPFLLLVSVLLHGTQPSSTSTRSARIRFKQTWHEFPATGIDASALVQLTRG